MSSLPDTTKVVESSYLLEGITLITLFVITFLFDSDVKSRMDSKCDYFITTDDRLLKYETGEIKIVDPIQFVKETEVEKDVQFN